MNAGEKSDDFVVLSTCANKAATALAEYAEGKKSPKESIAELTPMFRTSSRAKHHWECYGKSRPVIMFCVVIA